MQIDPKRMKKAASEAGELFSVLSNPRRLMILCRLVDGEASVGELAEFTGAAQTAVSQQLAVLRNVGLVSTRREAQTIYYSLSSAPARMVMEAAYGAFCAPAGKPRTSCKPGEKS